MKLSKVEINEVRDLFSRGMTEAQIRDLKLYDWCTLDAIKRVCGTKNAGFSVYFPPYIKDEKLRAKKIKELSEEKGKSYAEHLYLGWLKGEVSRQQLEQAYITAAKIRFDKYVGEKLQREVEWGA